MIWGEIDFCYDIFNKARGIGIGCLRAAKSAARRALTVGDCVVGTGIGLAQDKGCMYNIQVYNCWGYSVFIYLFFCCDFNV